MKIIKGDFTKNKEKGEGFENVSPLVISAMEQALQIIKDGCITSVAVVLLSDGEESTRITSFERDQQMELAGLLSMCKLDVLLDDE